MSMNGCFFLKGKAQTVVASGCFQQISVPAADGADLHGKFQTAVRRAVEEAKAAGIADPLVVGAIPFDSRQSSALYIPQKSATFDSPEEALKSYLTTEAPRDIEILGSKDNQDHEGYTSIVSQAVHQIKDQVLDKVVLARLRDFDISEQIASVDLLQRLAKQNPSGFTFQVPLFEEKSRLIGASPEMLVRKDGVDFYSQPLAGSAPRAPGKDAEIRENLLRSGKDLHEHKLVVDSMKTTLRPQSAELNVPETPECISTSKLWHLATSISGKVADPQDNVLALASRLHPTPALSGFPHENARELLTDLEPFDRRYFGGIVGYCDANGDGEWYIAIRCGEFTEKNIRLFAGAGIVGDSDPESEWRETEVKLSTMMHVLCPN